MYIFKKWLLSTNAKSATQKQKFTLLPPRHLLPGEIHQYNNFLIKEKADGLLIENLPIGIYPEHNIINNYQVKAEYIEELDLYLIFDIDIPNTTLIERYNILRQSHPYISDTLKQINNLEEFFNILMGERENIKIFLKENQKYPIKWYPKFSCIVNYFIILWKEIKKQNQKNKTKLKKNIIYN